MADLQTLKTALNKYIGDEETLNTFVAEAQSFLGDNWMASIYEVLSDVSGEERERLDHAYQYYAAITAWHEAQEYLNQAEPLDERVMAERIPVLEHWLAFFQESGLQVVSELREKLIAQSAVPEPETETIETPVTTPIVQTTSDVQEEQKPVQEKKTIWIFEKIKKQKALTQEVQSWVSARCISLGNKEVFHYPHYGFVVDLMKQTHQDIQSFFEDGELLVEAEEIYPGEIKELHDYQISLEKSLEVAAQNGLSEETDLVDDNLTADEVKKILGQLDTSNTPEFSGPAPDGFEPILDTEEEFNEQPIKDGYSQIENVVLSENKGELPKNISENEKNTSQMQQNGVKRKLSFSLGVKKATEN